MRAMLALAFSLLTMQALGQDAPFRLELVADDLSSPIYAIAPSGDPRLFVVEQSGTVRILKDGAFLPEPFLDISGDISCCGEQGLLGLAFHPDYANNGRFFVNYTNILGNTRVTEFKVSDDPDVASPDPVRDLLRVAQPYANHNGGWIDFGPDGLLYVALGDGGAGGDPHGNGQNMRAELGKILRLNVDGGQPEIFASGVRNPWRNAFDGDLLYIADVGQGAWEEIDVLSVGDAGANLGWNIMEGEACFSPTRDCNQEGLTLPVHVYDHGDGCSITGGFVYRGGAIPALQGRYVFADYCEARIHSLLYADGAVSEVTNWSDHGVGRLNNITSFGRDSAGELYVTTGTSELFKIVPAP
jgi:glucose/arabinose dehydrogenase